MTKTNNNKTVQEITTKRYDIFKNYTKFQNPLELLQRIKQNFSLKYFNYRVKVTFTEFSLNESDSPVAYDLDVLKSIIFPLLSFCRLFFKKIISLDSLCDCLF